MSSFTDYNPRRVDTQELFNQDTAMKFQDQHQTMLIKNHHINNISQLSQELADFGVQNQIVDQQIPDAFAEQKAGYNQKKKKISNIQANEMQMMLGGDGQIRNYALYSKSSKNNSITSLQRQQNAQGRPANLAASQDNSFSESIERGMA